MLLKKIISSLSTYFSVFLSFTTSIAILTTRICLFLHSYLPPGDLNRIKSTSFFQRIPPASELEKAKDKSLNQEETKTTTVPEEVPIPQQVSIVESAIVPLSESDSEEDEDDDIFDTAYIDVIASGEVKLAYIPGKYPH